MALKAYHCLMGVMLVLKVAETDATLTKSPSDKVAMLGDSVIFECFTARKDYPPSWYHTKVGSSDDKEIYTIVPSGGAILGRFMEGYDERLEVVEHRETGEYSLKIKSAQKEDAGRYRCKARGGLGQEGSAQLTVIESPVTCGSNANKVLGERICDSGPDYIDLSCRFNVTGNSLPEVSWVKTDEREPVLRMEPAHWSDEQGVAISNFVIRADQVNLNDSSFTCYLSSATEAHNRLSCTTPTINVLKFRDFMKSETLVSPEEVHCPRIPFATETGCKWVKRKLDEPESPEIVVTDGRTLNLYKPEMDSGLYVCIIECNIADKPCTVEAVKVTYQSPRISESTVSTVSTAVIISATVVATVLVVIAAIAVILCLLWIHRRRKEKGSESLNVKNSELYTGPAKQLERESLTSSSGNTNPPGSALSNGTTKQDELMALISNRESADVSEESQSQLRKDSGLTNGPAQQQESESLTDSTGSTSLSGSDSSNGTAKQHEFVPLTCYAGSADVSTESQSQQNHSAFDIPDAKLGQPGDRDLRLRRIEERARARMKMNAELRQGTSPEDNAGDVAEGLSIDTDKKSD